MISENLVSKRTPALFSYSVLSMLAVRFIAPGGSLEDVHLEKLTGSTEKSTYTDTVHSPVKQLGPHLVTLPWGPLVDSFLTELSKVFQTHLNMNRQQGCQKWRIIFQDNYLNSIWELNNEVVEISHKVRTKKVRKWERQENSKIDQSGTTVDIPGSQFPRRILCHIRTQCPLESLL